MYKLVRVGAAALALSATAVAAQPVTADELRRHIEILAGDDYEGREAGTAGGERTEAYILEAFAKAGLSPGAERGWRQTVSVTERTPHQATLSFQSPDGTPLAVKEVLLSGRDPTVQLRARPVIFAGHGTAEQMNGLDVRDAVLIMIAGDPPKTPDLPAWQDRRRGFTEAGAAAVITITAADVVWESVRPESRKVLTVEGETFPLAQGTMSHAAALAVLGGAKDGKALLAAAEDRGFRARRLPLTVSGTINSYIDALQPANIVGMVKGSSDRREAVVLMGHWDHTGLCRPEGEADRICNGAVDNASGLAVMIEVARRIASGPQPERDIYFVATTLEERGGFLGATAFATDPPPSVDRFVAVLNVDSIAIHPAGLPVAMIGRGRFPGLDRVADSVTLALGRKIDKDDEANVMIERQDGWAFTRLGIPSVMVSGSFSDMDILKAYLASSYHQPNDAVSPQLLLGGAVEDANLHVALLRSLADPKNYPTPKP